MRVLIHMDIDTPNLHPGKDYDPDEAAEQVESEKDSIIEGMTSVDMEKAVAECLGTWYLSLRDEDVEVTFHDAVEVVLPRDRRKLRRFTMSTNGGIRQEDI
jgi:hypothetical protein